MSPSCLRIGRVRADKHTGAGQVFELAPNYGRTPLQLNIQPDGQACSYPRSHTGESGLHVLNQRPCFID
jgi:hypothetical protein